MMSIDADGRSETTERIRVGMAEYRVATDQGVITTSGLGSCLGVALYDAEAGVAGLAHPMRPSHETVDDDIPSKFVDAGTEALLDEMREQGADPGNVTAKLAGASEMFAFSFDDSGVGERNVARAHEVLDRLGIPVIAEDVGGDSGRSLKLQVVTGKLVIKRANGSDAVV